MIFCKNCGRQLNDGEIFCAGCGAATDASVTSESTHAVSKLTYAGIGISAVIAIVALFAPWIKASNGTANLPGFWTGLGNVKNALDLLSKTFGRSVVDSSDIIILQVAVASAFIIPLYNVWGIISVFMRKKTKKNGKAASPVNSIRNAAIFSISICFIWLILISMLNGSALPYLVVLMKSGGDFMSTLFSLRGIGTHVLIGMGIWIVIVLSIINIIVSVIDETKPSAKPAKVGAGGISNEGNVVVQKERSTLTKYILKACPIAGIAFSLVLVSFLINNSVSFFIGHALCLILASMTAVYIGLPVGFIVTAIYGFLYALAGYEFYFVFDGAFIIGMPILLRKYQDFKIRISCFAGIGVAYGILIFAARGGSGKRFYDGRSIIPVLLHYVALCVSVFLFHEFGWPQVKLYLPEKIQKFFTPVITKDKNNNDSIR